MHYLYFSQKNIYFYLQNLLVYIYTSTKGTFILDRTWQCTRHNKPHNPTASTERDRASPVQLSIFRVSVCCNSN